MQIEKQKLSKDLIVACEIYKAELKKESIWFTYIVEKLKNKVSKIEISMALDTLSDWGIIEYEYGPTGKGRAGCLFKITSHHKQKVKELYEEFYINGDDNIGGKNADCKNKR